MSRRVGIDILGWNDDYEVEFFGETEDNRYYGVELEIDDGNLDRLRMYLNGDSSLDDKLYLVEDGSLDRGIEIVTNPMTLDYFKENEFWQKVTEYARRADFTSHDNRTCGLHIHVSRRALTEDVLDNLLFLNERFWSRWVQFSRRSAESMDRWAEKLTGYSEATVTKDNVKSSGDYHRYNAINLDNNATVEFRIFKGTLAPNTVIASIELVDYMIDVAEEFANDESKDIEKLTWVEFVKGIGDDRGKLVNYLEKRDLLITSEAEARREEKERYEASLNSIMDKVKGSIDDLLMNNSFDEDLHENNLAMDNYLRGNRDGFYSMNSERNQGDLIVLHSAEDNPIGRGYGENFYQVFVHSHTSERGNEITTSNYIYTKGISSKLIPINPTTVYNNHGNVVGVYNYMALDFFKDVQLINVRDRNRGPFPYVVADRVDMCNDMLSIKFEVDSSSMEERFGLLDYARLITLKEYVHSRNYEVYSLERWEEEFEFVKELQRKIHQQFREANDDNDEGYIVYI